MQCVLTPRFRERPSTGHYLATIIHVAVQNMNLQFGWPEETGLENFEPLSLDAREASASVQCMDGRASFLNYMCDAFLSARCSSVAVGQAAIRALIRRRRA